MAELRMAILNASDIDLLEVVGDPESHDAEDVELAHFEIKRRGGLEAVAAKARETRFASEEKIERLRLSRMPFRARFTAWACIVIASLTAVTWIQQPQLLSRGGAFVILFSIAVILLSITILRASLFGIAVFTGLMSLGGTLLLVSVVRDVIGGASIDQSKTGIGFCIAFCLLLAAGLVASCWKSAGRLRSRVETDQDEVD